MEDNNTNQINQEVTNESVAVNTLPSFKSCLTDSWEFAKTRFDLILLVLVTTLPSIYMSMMDARSGNFMEDNAGLSAVIMLWSLIVSPLITWVVLYMVLHRQESPALKLVVTKYLPRHILPLFWLMFISSLVTFGGLMVFIVPAIILGIYMTFSTIVLVAEDKRGLGAILRSHQLVSGYWLAIAGRVIGVSLIWGLASMIVSIFGDIGVIISSVVQTVAVVAVLYVIASLYQARLANPALITVTPPPRRLYQTFISLGLIVILMGTAAALYYISIMSGIDLN